MLFLYRNGFQRLRLLHHLNKLLARLEARHEVLVDDDGGVLGDVPSHLASALFVDEAAEATYVDIVAFGHGITDHFEEFFDRG